MIWQEHHSARHCSLRVFAYPFHDVETRAQNYWRDVGNVDALYEANMELVALNPELNIYDHQWPIWTYQAQQPPAKFVLDDDGRRGMAVNSMVAGGCIISGAYVNSRCCRTTCASRTAPSSRAPFCFRESPSAGAARSALYSR